MRMAQTVFIDNVPFATLSRIETTLASAPGLQSVERLQDKVTGKDLGTIFCRIHNGVFDKFKRFLESQKEWPSSITIREGVTL